MQSGKTSGIAHALIRHASDAVFSLCSERKFDVGQLEDDADLLRNVSLSAFTIYSYPEGRESPPLFPFQMRRIHESQAVFQRKTHNSRSPFTDKF
jgi:hypothetical protein